MGEEDLTIDLEALIASAKAAHESAAPEHVEVLLGDELVTVRLWPLAPSEWRVLHTGHPPRTVVVDGETQTSPADVAYGCDIDAVTRAYPRVALVKGDDEHALDAGTWARIVDVLPLGGLQGVMATIAYMNIAEPAQRFVEALGKAARAGEPMRPASPDSSE